MVTLINATICDAGMHISIEHENGVYRDVIAFEHALRIIEIKTLISAELYATARGIYYNKVVQPEVTLIFQNTVAIKQCLSSPPCYERGER